MRSIAALSALTVSAVACAGIIEIPTADGYFDTGHLGPAGQQVYEWQFDLVEGQAIGAMVTSNRFRFDDPDTMIAIYDDQGTQIFYIDDDDGDTNKVNSSDYNSSLFYRATDDGTYTVKVTGYDDDDFVGDHDEVGGFGFAAITTGASVPPRGVSWGPGGSIPIAGYGSAATATVLGEGEVHEYTIDLNAGDSFTAMTMPLSDDSFETPDTVIELRGPNGDRIVINDDGPEDDDGDGYGSLIRASVGLTGTYTLRVTGYDDFGFNGNHTEAGDYGLLVMVIPAPASALAFAAAAVPFARRRR